MANINAARFFDVCNCQDYFDMKYNGVKTITAGRAHLHPAEAQWIYENKNYILTSSDVYQPCYSVNAGYYFIRVHHLSGAGYCKRGRFHVGDAAFINQILGYELLAA